MRPTNGTGSAARRPSRRLVGGILGVVILIGVVVGLVTALERGPAPRKALPGVLRGPAPWGSNTDDLSARLRALGLPDAGVTVAPLFHLAVVVNGRRLQVPAGIGGSSAPLRTGDTSGTVAGTGAGDLTLGEFFAIWGVRFTPDCVGGYCGTVAVTVNGAPVPGDPRRLRLLNGQRIVVSSQA